MLICDHASKGCPPGCPCATEHPHPIAIYGTTLCTDAEPCPHVLQVVKCVEI